MDFVCVGCGRGPEEISEYLMAAYLKGTTPRQILVEEEGTFNPKNGHFYCTDCYVEMGMPLGEAP